MINLVIKNFRVLFRILLNIFTVTFIRQSIDRLGEFVMENVYPVRIINRGANSSISSSARFLNPENIRIGSRTNINRNCILWAGKKSKIVIGNDCLTGPGVTIIASQYKVKGRDIIRSYSQIEEDIIVEDDVWLGANCVIISGVHVGKGAIVGAGSVVVKNVEPYSIVAGVPSKLIRERKH